MAQIFCFSKKCFFLHENRFFRFQIFPNLVIFEDFPYIILRFVRDHNFFRKKYFLLKYFVFFMRQHWITTQILHPHLPCDYSILIPVGLAISAFCPKTAALHRVNDAPLLLFASNQDQTSPTDDSLRNHIKYPG